MTTYPYSNATSLQLWFLCEGFQGMLYDLHVHGYISQAQFHAYSSDAIWLATRAERT